MSHLNFNEESDYSEQNTCDNEVFRSTILHHRKKLNIFTLQLPIYYTHIRIRNLDWCKCGHCKNEERKIDCLCCREVDAMLIASAKIPELQRKHLAIPLLWVSARLIVIRVSLIYLVDEFIFLFLA